MFAEIDLPHPAVVVGIILAVFKLEGVALGYGQVFLVGEVGDVAGLGGGGEAPQHSEKFVIDERALETGVGLYVQVALDYLSK